MPQCFTSPSRRVRVRSRARICRITGSRELWRGRSSNAIGRRYGAVRPGVQSILGAKAALNMARFAVSPRVHANLASGRRCGIYPRSRPFRPIGASSSKRPGRHRCQADRIASLQDTATREVHLPGLFACQTFRRLVAHGLGQGFSVLALQSRSPNCRACVSPGTAIHGRSIAGSKPLQYESRLRSDRWVADKRQVEASLSCGPDSEPATLPLRRPGPRLDARSDPTSQNPLLWRRVQPRRT